MRQSKSETPSTIIQQEDSNPDKIALPIIEMLARLHVLVIGPGLGRDPLMQDTVERVIRAARAKGIPLVLDADALQLVQKDLELIKGYSEAVLTPNVVEFDRLCKAAGVGNDDNRGETDRVEALANALGGVTVIQKGRQDFISDGVVTLIDDLEGGKKRSGGQGDTLTGSVATFLAWRKAYNDQLWNDPETPHLEKQEMIGLAAFGGSAITRVSESQYLHLNASSIADQNAFLHDLYRNVLDLHF